MYGELTVMDSIITVKISETTDNPVKQSVYMVPQIETSTNSRKESETRNENISVTIRQRASAMSHRRTKDSPTGKGTLLIAFPSWVS
jgi:hypothetical protein